MALKPHCLRLLLACCLLGAPGAWAAVDMAGDHLRLSGFATLALTQGGNQDLGFRRDIYREGLFDGDVKFPPESLLGIQLDARFTDQLGGAIQLVGKDQLVDSIENSLEWAYLSYQINPQWQVRAGRIGLDVYLLSEYRSLGFSYLWARPPMEFYTAIPFDSFDGMDLTWSRQWHGGWLRAKVYGGQTANDFQINSEVVELKLNPILGATLVWESDRWELRMTAATNEVDEPSGYFPGMAMLAEGLLQLAPVWPQAEELVASLEVDNKRFYYYAAGIAYDAAPWQIQAEVSRVESEVGVYPSIDSAYLSLGRQIGPVTLFGVLASASGNDDRLVVSAPPPPFQGLQAQLQPLWDGFNVEQDSLSLGLRWDVRYDMAVKCQWDRTWISRYGVGLWDIRQMPADDPVIDTLSLNLNVIF